ncbi:MAG: malic enzyme-like NAD(P)-binding protein [Planctomycetota bacterium]
MKIPQVLLLEVVHAPGNLAKVLTVVGRSGLTIEGLQQSGRTQDKTTWELTIEMERDELAPLCVELEKIDIVHVKGTSDRVFTRHEGGKIETGSRVVFEDLQVLRDVYTPGVARVCLAIQEKPELARRYTGIGRTVAIVTNGTAVLGLGDIGAVAGMPVMEGKAALFHAFGGVSGVPILIESGDADEIVRTVTSIAPSFGAIQLEDIRAPECFEIEERLIEALDIPVLHDDQHGTAVVVLAALMSAARITGVDLTKATIGQIGLGAAGLGIARLLNTFGVAGVIGADLSEDALTRLESYGGRRGSLEDVMAQGDIVVATTGVPGLIKPEMVREGQIVFALSNPDPEIEPRLALERGARFAADGKNINNVLAFPGLFRGAMDAGAARFTDPMLVEASRAISDAAPEGALIPNALDKGVHDCVAAAVLGAAVELD